MQERVLSEKLQARPPARVLVIQTAFLVDSVFSAALAGAFARRFPAAELDVCVAPRGRDVALAFPGVGQVYVYDKRGADGGLSGLRRVAARLATRRYDLAVLPHTSIRSALLARLAGIPERVGFAGAPGSLLYTGRVRTRASTFLGREADLARAVGAAPAAMGLLPRTEWLESARKTLAPAAGEKPAAACLGPAWATPRVPPLAVPALV